MIRAKVILSMLIWVCCAITVQAGALSQYTCHRAVGPVAIDGKLDDAAWRNADVITFIMPVTDKQTLSKTEARVLWDDSCLYVAYRAYDKDIWSLHKNRDDQTCAEDCLECFLQPNPARQTYYNFEINANGTIYDSYNVGRNSGGYGHHRWSVWNCERARVGIAVTGTLNQWTDADSLWQMELAIPFAELPSLNGKGPSAGDVWRFLLARYDYSVYLPDGVEISSCSHLKAVDFHDPSDWLQLKFAD
ncbi:MAG: carbohydrate-binding family 9-like protein [Armatimonadetes bacterium]|nr:carbohydrate-binding family 9-like protein [Armatimonadota bacterium]